MFRFALCASLVALAPGLAAQDRAGIAASEQQFAGRPYSPYANRAFPTQVYFGDTHGHTGLSADAGGAGTTLLLRDAYRFARGEQVTSNIVQPVKLSRPLDFYVITDHSDGMGAIIDVLRGAPNVMADEQGHKILEGFNSRNPRDAVKDLASKIIPEWEHPAVRDIAVMRNCENPTSSLGLVKRV